VKRVLVVGLVVAALAIGGPALAAPTATADGGVEQQISDAFARVFDEALPMRERLAVLEDGASLRTTMKRFDDLEQVSGFNFRSVDLVVQAVRAHDGDAEVQLSVFADYYMVTGWSGVARKIDGRWVVARSTVCTLFADWTRLRCPGGPKAVDYSSGHTAQPRSRNGDTVLALTFTDGGRADLMIPSDLAEGWQIIPHAELVLGEHTPIRVYFQPGRAPARQPVRKYAGAPDHAGAVLDAMSGLVVPIDTWTAFVTADRLSERERRLVAKHLDGYTTKTGFPVLIPSAPLRFHRPETIPATGARLVKSALNVDDAANPMELWYTDGDQLSATVVVTPGPCPAELQAPMITGTYRAEERCTSDGFGRIAVEGTGDIVERLLDELRVVNYRAALVTTSA